MIQTWRLYESRLALFTDNPHVEKAAQETGLAHMADYVKDGKLLAVQYAGPDKFFAPSEPKIQLSLGSTKGNFFQP